MAIDTSALTGPRKRTAQRLDPTHEDESLAHYPPEVNVLSKDPLNDLHFSSSNKTSPIVYLEKVSQKDQHACNEALGGKDPNTSDPFDETAVIPEIEEGDDDPDMPTVTVRAFLVGLLMAIFGAAVSQIFMYKPVHLHPHPLFVQLACLILGRAFASIPGPLWWNPGPLNVKETVFAAIMATAGAAGTPSVEMVATQELFFDRKMHPLVIILTLLSSQLIGYGWAGLLRRFLVYPARTIFPGVLPSVALFKSLGQYTPDVEVKVKFFKKVFLGTTLYQIIPTYVAPVLQAISPWCLTLPQVPAITNVFGGSMVAEGMGLCFQRRLDTGSHGPLFVPLFAQITQWASVAFSIFLMGAAYRFNFFALQSNTTIHRDGTENVEGVAALGLPYHSPTFIVCQVGSSLAVTSAITTAIVCNWEDIKAAFRKGESGETEDPHRTITKNYTQFPEWAFAILAALFMGLAFLSSYLGESGLSVGALLTAFSISAVLSLAAGFFNATIGIGLHCHHAWMNSGLMFPGNAIANMWFTLFGSTSVAQSVAMLRDLKLGQYMHLSPLSVVFSQLVGTVAGGFTHYFVMVAILSSQRDVLLLPNGNGVFTVMALSTFAAESTTFVGSLQQKALPRWTNICNRPVFFDNRILLTNTLLVDSLVEAASWDRQDQRIFVLFESLWCYPRCNVCKDSGNISRILHPILYEKIPIPVFDGATQFMMSILTLTLQGGAGFKVDMPTYFLNPQGARDYCYLPSAKH
ncbi:hypothetical protein KEM48_011745 [Puccinia striiformis f. sp. tritici PST-130]|nr:hypothetical protein KEM48_011745 [Puccinia striiformis f. sp. tritici PST-130]